MALAIYAGYDPARSGAVSVTLTETGGGGATGSAAITTPLVQRYDLLVVSNVNDQGETTSEDLGYDTASALLAAALTSVGNATYSCTFSTSTQKTTITASGGGVTAFTLSSPTTAFTRIFGAPASTSSLVWTSASKCWYQIQCEVGGLADIKLPYESADDLSSDMTTNDGHTYGTSLPGSVKRFDATVPFEPRAKVNAADMTDAWTFEHLKRHARNIEPIIIDLDGTLYTVRFRADATAHAPQQVSANYLAYYNVPLATHFLGYST